MESFDDYQKSRKLPKRIYVYSAILVAVIFFKVYQNFKSPINDEEGGLDHIKIKDDSKPAEPPEGRFTFDGLVFGKKVPMRLVMYLGGAENAHADDSTARAGTIRAEVSETVSRLTSRFNLFDPGSELSDFNRHLSERNSSKASPDLTHVMQAARHFHELTDGAFDVTVGPLKDLWSAAQAAQKVPADDDLSQALRMVGKLPEYVTGGSDNDVFVNTTGHPVKIDLGGISKGYIIDCAASKMAELGASSGIADIGGDVKTFGVPTNRDHWIVGVRRPFDLKSDDFVGANHEWLIAYLKKLLETDESGQLIMYLKMQNSEAVATSGNYMQYYTINGTRYNHIFDPKTGQPVEHVVSVTVIGPDAMSADAMATGLTVMGHKKAFEKRTTFCAYEYLIVEHTPDGWYAWGTDGLRGYLYVEFNKN